MGELSQQGRGAVAGEEKDGRRTRGALALSAGLQREFFGVTQAGAPLPNLCPRKA